MRHFPLFRAAAVLLLGVLAVLHAGAAETPIPPSPTRWVTDTAGFVSEGARRQLDKRLEAYERANGHQVLVWIGKTTGDATIEDWAVRAFKAWKVGRAKLDDGVVLFIMAEDRKLRIEVGYGLEGTMPDAAASRIINEGIVPKLKAGDPDGAVRAGVNGMLGAIGGVDAGAQRERRDSGARSSTRMPADGLSIFEMLLYGFLGIGLLIFVITNPSLAFLFLLNALTSSGHRRGGFSGGGFSGGGGGFSGGGGRSGGGGASGSW